MNNSEMNGYGLTLIPRSWAFGLWHKSHKSLFAVGPFRFVKYKNIQGTYGG